MLEMLGSCVLFVAMNGIKLKYFAMVGPNDFGCHNSNFSKLFFMSLLSDFIYVTAFIITYSITRNMSFGLLVLKIKM
jgi:hypothetical protein